MLRQTTLKLSLSIFLNALGAALLSIIIILAFGSIGAKTEDVPSSSTTANSSSAASSSVETSSSSLASTSSKSVAGANPQAIPSQIADIKVSTGGLITTTGGKILLGGISILIIFAMAYSAAWNEGNKDPNRINYGHMKKFMLKGLVAGAIAIIPFFIYTIIFLIFKLGFDNLTFTRVLEVIYRLLNMEFVIFGDGWLTNPLACFSILLIYPLASTIGYYAGFHRFQLMPRIIYKDNGKPKNKRQLKRYNELKK